MTIRFRCSAGHKLSVSDDLAGRKVRCPTCNAKVAVPSESTATDEAPDDGGVESPPIAAPPLPEPPLKSAPVAASPPIASAAPADEKDNSSPSRVKPEAMPEPAKPVAAKAAMPFPDADERETTTRQRKDSGNDSGNSHGKKAAPPSTTKPKDKQPDKSKAKSEDALPFPEEASESSVPFPEAQPPGKSSSLPPADAPVAIQTETQAYAPEPGRIQSTYLLAVGMAGVSLLALAPALPHINIFAAPPWAVLALAIGLFHMLYIFWVVSLPDWSTVWIGGCLFAATSLGYLASAGIAAMRVSWFGLAEQRGTAISWATVLAVLFGVIAFGCFRYAANWRREFEMNS